MTGPFILLAGAVIQKASGLRTIKDPKTIGVAVLAVAANQVMDFANGKIFDGGDARWTHYAISIIGILAVTWLFRRYWWGWGWAVLPDIIDWWPSELQKWGWIDNPEVVAEWGRNIHRVFWNPMWTDWRWGSLWMTAVLAMAIWVFHPAKKAAQLVEGP